MKTLKILLSRSCATAILVPLVFIFWTSSVVGQAALSSASAGAGANAQAPAQSAAQPSAGTSPTPNVGATILSYQAQDEIGHYIAGAIENYLASVNPISRPKIFITAVAPNAGSAQFLYKGVIYQLKEFASAFSPAIESYERANTNYFGSNKNARNYEEVIAAATNVMGALSQLVALDSTSTTMSSVSVATNEMAIIPGLIKVLRANKSADCEYVDLFANTDYITKKESLFYYILKISRNRSLSQALVSQWATMSNGMTQFTPGYLDLATNKTKDIAKGVALQQTILSMLALNMAYDSCVSNILSTNLNNLLTADFYQNNVHGKSDHYLLFVRSLYAGGDNRVKSNPLFNVVTDGPRISYIGGAVATYFLINENGETVLSDTLRDFDGFNKVPGDAWTSWLPKITNNLVPIANKRATKRRK